MPASDALLTAHALSAERGGNVLFENVRLALAPGTVTLLRGANGTGKTTLLRMLAGLSSPASGDVERTTRVLYWGHASAVKDELTPIENLRQLTASNAVADEALAAILSTCGLERRLHVVAKRLSAGQRRRILLARLLLSHEQPIWLLDEPTAALDADGLAQLAAALNQHVHVHNGAVLIATHAPIDGLDVPPQVMELHHAG
jgi:heme exporter protein A